MEFPLYIHIGSLKLHPHFVFESLSYLIGFRVYLFKRKKGEIPAEKSIWIIIGAILGAALGSKIIYWFENPTLTIENWANMIYLMQGKTIVGGLLGGLIGVEIAKKCVGWYKSTGDDMVLALIIGMSIGRIGCFLTGISDHTYGTETTLPFGIDFGDGIMRHPTQLYEIAFLLLLLILLQLIKVNFILPWNGLLFQLFMLSYLTFRLFVDFIKPVPHVYGIFNNIQVAAMLGIIYYVVLIFRKARNTYA